MLVPVFTPSNTGLTSSPATKRECLCLFPNSISSPRIWRNLKHFDHYATFYRLRQVQTRRHYHHWRTSLWRFQMIMTKSRDGLISHPTSNHSSYVFTPTTWGSTLFRLIRRSEISHFHACESLVFGCLIFKIGYWTYSQLGSAGAFLVRFLTLPGTDRPHVDLDGDVVISHLRNFFLRACLP